MTEPIFDDNPGGGLDADGLMDLANELAYAGLYDEAASVSEIAADLLSSEE